MIAHVSAFPLEELLPAIGAGSALLLARVKAWL